MKIDCGETYAEKLARLESWHPFYPWIPRRVGSHDCRAFEWIERRGKLHCGYGDCYWTWEYRAKPKG